MIKILRSDQVRACPEHKLDPSHYTPEGCLCIPVGKLTLKQKELQALSVPCPVCDSPPGSACLHQQSTRTLKKLKFPHPERIKVIDPTWKVQKYRKRAVTGGSGWQSSTWRNAAHAKRNTLSSAGEPRKPLRKRVSSPSTALWPRITGTSCTMMMLSAWNGRRSNAAPHPGAEREAP